MATITDVARLAGVSPATVSRVLNGTSEVTSERAERVRAAVEELGYRPFSPARALRRGATNVWAVIVPDIGNPFFTSVVRGLEDTAWERGFRVVLCNSDGDPGKERDYIDVAIGERMGGVVIASAAGGGKARIKPLTAAGIPVVAIDRGIDGAAIDSVVVDNKEGARQAVAHLLGNGAKRVGIVTGPESAATANERLAGYSEALKAAKVKGDASLVARSDFHTEGGYKAVTQMCVKRNRPDALFLTNNLMTLGGLQAVRDLGLRIPDDIAVVGWDDGPWATVLDPPLTVVAQPTEQIGRTAAELLATVDTGGTPRHVVLPTTLVVRASSTRR